MMNIALRDTLVSDLGINTVFKAYHEAAKDLDKAPSFIQIYEAYVDLYTTEKTNLENREIDTRLLELKMENSHDVFDVEHGFQLSEYGIPKGVEIFNALLQYQFFFEMEGFLYNAPVVGVW